MRTDGMTSSNQPYSQAYQFKSKPCVPTATANMDPNHPNIQKRTTPAWGLMQKDMFWAPNEGEFQPFDTEPENVAAMAKQRLSENGWFYSACNAGIGWTHNANRMAFYRHRIIPRMLVDTTARDTATELFGHKLNAPIGFAPIGINRIYHPTGETSPAKVAAELGLAYSLSSAGSYSIEEVGKANGDGCRFFQLYQSPDDEQALSMLQRAHDSGFTACMLTTDTWQLAWRHHDVHIGNYAFYHEHGPGDIALNDPVFLKRCEEAGVDPHKEPRKAGAKWMDENIWHGHSFTWEKAKWTMEQWKRISGGRPFLLKGIQSVHDARKAVEMGCDGIVVSNHAGRQVDGAIASLDALEKIVDAVGDRIVITFDSGIRTAADVFKALALGAKFVWIGRPYVWGLSIAGETGVRHVVKALLAELDILMNVSGYPDLKALDREALDSLPRVALMPTNAECD